jgi:hypothetical protein
MMMNVEALRVKHGAPQESSGPLDLTPGRVR